MSNFLVKAYNAVNQMLRPRAAFTTRPLGLSPLNFTNTAIYPQVAMETYVRAYFESATVYTIVAMMARKWGFIPRYLYEVDSKDKEAMSAKRSYRQMIKQRDPNLSGRKLKKLLTKAYQDDVVEDQPLSKLLAQPNPYMGQDSYYATIYTFKKLTGNAFVWLNRGDNDNVLGDARYDLEVFNMWVLPSQFVTINVNRDILFGEITGYTFYDSGQPIYLAKEDILHWRDPNPGYDSYNFTQYYGTPPLQPGLRLLTQDNSQTDAAVAMFQNGGSRGVIYNENFTNLNKLQQDQSDDAINTKINNRAMKSAVAYLAGKHGYLDISKSAVDMELLDSQDATFGRISNLLGCNPQVFGSADTTFNNVEQARKDLMTSALCPDACSFRDEENRVLLRAFGYKPSDKTIDIDITDMPELADDMDKLTTRVLANYTLTSNEKREELGHEHLVDPDMDVVLVPNNLVPIADAVMPPLDPMLNDTSGITGNDNGASGSGVSDVPKGHTGNGHSKRLSLTEVDEIWSKAGTTLKNGKPL